MKGKLLNPTLPYAFDYLADLFRAIRGTGNPADVPSRRPCLCCGHVFRSRGLGHRICDTCKRLGNDSKTEDRA